MMEYTEQELEEAKAYLRNRLRNESSMSADVLRLLEMYAAYLLTALFGNVTDNDIELLISDLINELLADCETLAVDEHDKKAMILLYMNGERNGDTLRGRVSERCHTLFNEIFAVYTAGRLMNLNYQTVLSSVKANFKHPWDNEILVAAREKQRRGEIAQDYAFSEPHFGRGVEISSAGALDTILTYAVADAWMYWGWLDASERGAKGYFVERGSSYNCPLCDSMCGVFRDISDTEHLPPFHLSCCCFVVYSFVDRL